MKFFDFFFIVLLFPQEALSIPLEDEEEEEMFSAPQWEEMNTIWRACPTYIAANERNIFMFWFVQFVLKEVAYISTQECQLTG